MRPAAGLVLFSLLVALTFAEKTLDRVAAAAAAGESEDVKKPPEEEPEIVTAATPLDDTPSDSETSSFQPPKDEDMLRFEAKEAIVLKRDENEEETSQQQQQQSNVGRELYESAMSLLNSSSSPSSKHQAWNLIGQAAELGNVDAIVKIGFSQLLGTYYDQDIAKAKATFEKAADEHGHPDAQFGLGFLHATGTLANSSQSKALLHYAFGAFGGSSFSQMALGYRYWSGMGVATSCEKALDYYRRVAQTVADKVSFGGGAAIQRTRLQDEHESGGFSNAVLDNDLIEYYQLLADKGDVEAQVGLGQLHYQGGRGIEMNHRLALNYFTQAAETNNPIAMAMLGKLYLMGSGEAIKANNDTAFMYFKRSADMGNAIGQSGLGLMYLEGRGVARDYKKAMDYFRKAADQQWVDGQLQLGIMYYQGRGVAPDYKMAVKYFNMASQSGHVLAFYNLAEMHAMGTGMLRSCPTAVELYKNVAERGQWGELMMEAHADYRHGRLEEAVVKYLLLAELGYEVAQSNVAFLFDRKEVGSGVGAGDVTGTDGTAGPVYAESELWLRALVYWTRAAAQGYSAARVRLGDYYYYGLGTEIDFEAAAFHYRIASEQQNNAQAMFNLGYMHELGHGMPQDVHLAKRFYDMAAETSTDAKVPVALALAKLAVTFAVNNWQNYRVVLSPEAWARLELYWDLYLLTLLVGVLGVVIFLRRPFNAPARPAAAPAAAAPPQPQPAAAAQQPAAPATPTAAAAANQSQTAAAATAATASPQSNSQAVAAAAATSKQSGGDAKKAETSTTAVKSADKPADKSAVSPSTSAAAASSSQEKPNNAAETSSASSNEQQQNN